MQAAVIKLKDSSSEEQEMYHIPKIPTHGRRDKIPNLH